MLNGPLPGSACEKGASVWPGRRTITLQLQRSPSIEMGTQEPQGRRGAGAGGEGPDEGGGGAPSRARIPAWSCGH